MNSNSEAARDSSDDELIVLMAKHPDLTQRPAERQP
jgi:hypothetical protein